MTYHEPALLKETIDSLDISPSGVYVDATFGGGGHSRSILLQLKSGRLFAFDQDADARVNLPRSKKLVFVHGNFRFMANYLRYYDIRKVDGIIADLGVSSHHFDTPGRGFSYRFDGPLDMRMNPTSALTAATIINTYTAEALMKLFGEYGEVIGVGRLVRFITEARQRGAIASTSQLLEAIRPCIPAATRNQYLSKIFQALRIEVNREITNLKEFIRQATMLLNPGGRLAIISYHSLEDRLVKSWFQHGNFEGRSEKDIYGHNRLPLRMVNRRPLMPEDTEIMANSRARSARLRVAEKL